jgi:hypothetical protein
LVILGWVVQSYAKVDRASEKHDLLVQEAGEEMLATKFSHDERGPTAVCCSLVRLNVVLTAIEQSDGLLIECLLEAG